MSAPGADRAWRIRVRGAMSTTVAEALPDVTVIETGPTTLLESDRALGETIDHLQSFGLEVVEIHASQERWGRPQRDYGGVTPGAGG